MKKHFQNFSIIEEKAHEDADIIFGTTTDNSLAPDEIKVTIVATGFEKNEAANKEDIKKNIETILILDAFSGLQALAEEYREAYRAHQALVNEREEALKNREERLRRIDYLAFQIQDIEKISPLPGEEEDLRRKRDLLRQGERLKEALARAIHLLDGEGISVTQGLRESLGLLSPLAPLSQELEGEVKGLEEALILVQEGVSRLETIQEKVEVDPQALAQVEERLDTLHRLKSRYGPTLEAVLEYLERARKELAHLEAIQERTQDLEKEVEEALERVWTLGRRLGEARREGARRLEKAVEENLARLMMEDCVFQVRFQGLEEPGPHGLEAVEFYIQTNPGEEAKPLNRIASGGELSRISLAIRRVLSDIKKIPVLVLDEIDAGIGGITAQKVGELLAELGERHQVICITHLPQVARHAHHQMAVEKGREGGKTLTTIRALSPSEREMELKRMMGERVDDPRTPGMTETRESTRR
jgi:DNA repair protein RecN (Recombination protein N)